MKFKLLTYIGCLV